MSDDVRTSGNESATGALDAHEDDECLLCEPAPHPNCEKYTVLLMNDPSKVPLGEGYEENMVEIPVCLGHYQAFEQYQQADSVAEVDVV